MDSTKTTTNDWTTYRRSAGFVTGSEVLEATYPDKQWIVQGWIARGDLVVLAGRPKSGKSLLSTQMALAVSQGRPFLGQFGTHKSTVLFMDLDDRNERRLQERIEDLNGGVDDGMQDLLYHKELKPAKEGGLQEIEQYLTKAAECGVNVGLILIDCLLAFAGKQDGRDIIGSDRAQLEPVRALAAKHNVGIVLIHHTRKSSKMTEGFSSLDSMLGTTGLSTVFDTGIVIENSDRKEKKILFDSRDARAPRDLILEKDVVGLTGWKVKTVEADPHNGERPLTGTAAVIVEVLGRHPGLTPTEISTRAAEMGKTAKVNGLGVYLTRLVGRGKIVKSTGGKYSLPELAKIGPEVQPHTPCYFVSPSVSDRQYSANQTNTLTNTSLEQTVSVSGNVNNTNRLTPANTSATHTVSVVNQPIINMLTDQITAVTPHKRKTGQDDLSESAPDEVAEEEYDIPWPNAKELAMYTDEGEYVDVDVDEDGHPVIRRVARPAPDAVKIFTCPGQSGKRTDEYTRRANVTLDVNPPGRPNGEKTCPRHTKKALSMASAPSSRPGTSD